MEPVQKIVSQPRRLPLKEIQKYLVQFGYVSGMVSPADASPAPTLQALARFQRFYGIDAEDEEERTRLTLGTMVLRRCGVVDAEDGEIKQGCSWPVGQDTLVYEIENETEDLAPGESTKAIRQAIVLWNAVLDNLQIPLHFKEREEEEGVHVRFSWKKNDADMPFSVPPVAHADFPPACGTLSTTLPRPVHFEEKQDWAVDSSDPERLSIVFVAVHEIGHILGLTHSSDPSSVMFSSLQHSEEPTASDQNELKKLYQKHIDAQTPPSGVGTVILFVEPPVGGSMHP